ncbi:DUF5305 family protein [Bacillus sp. JJ1521]|uniref:DUF5305 family protein n=1 Tax=Bacillus sp. JJ1521 TaxID=3122957 RepID=UPI002FFF0C72
MIEGFSIKLKRYKNKLSMVIIILLVVSVVFTIYSFLQPATTTVQINDNLAQIETGFDYKAEITPNILYPNGGTVDVGETFFKKITAAIPFHLKSTIYSEGQVTAMGTHEVQLLINAGDIWERKFPLEQKQAFEERGTDILVVDHTYKIDLEQVKAFIKQVEEETGIVPGQYTLEVLPNIQGTINGVEIEEDFQLQDRLVFQYSYEEIQLASEKNFTSMLTVTSSEVAPNFIKIFGKAFTLSFVRISSTLFSILLLLVLVYSRKNLKANSILNETSELDIINKRYANRIIPVLQKINLTQKSIFVLDSFKSIIKISDEKELPIFSNRDEKGDISLYFIVDGDYLYTYETDKVNRVSDTEKIAGSDKKYASG